MPGGNRTGPQGQGPLTGRGLGPCGSASNSNVPIARNQPRGSRFVSVLNRMFGYGQGLGRGTGQGRRGGRRGNR
jgi:hypothetical protein